MTTTDTDTIEILNEKIDNLRARVRKLEASSSPLNDLTIEDIDGDTLRIRPAKLYADNLLIQTIGSLVRLTPANQDILYDYLACAKGLRT